MWGDLWQYPFVSQTWGTVWQAVAAVGTVGTLTYTLRLFNREKWRHRTAEARQVLIWNESPGASTDNDEHTYHNTVHLVNASPRPIHDVNIQVVLPSLREYNKRRKLVPQLDAPSYSKRYRHAPMQSGVGVFTPSEGT